MTLQLRDQKLQLLLREKECRKEAATEYARMVMAHHLQAKQFSKDFGQMAIRSLFLLNGGALVSLVTLLGSISNFTYKYPDELVPSNLMSGFPLFLTGLGFAVVMMFMSYMNFGKLSESFADFGSLANAIVELEDTWPHDPSHDKKILIWLTYWGALVFGVASLVCFFAGCLKIIGPAASFWWPGMLFAN